MTLGVGPLAAYPCPPKRKSRHPAHSKKAAQRPLAAEPHEALDAGWTTTTTTTTTTTRVTTAHWGRYWRSSVSGGPRSPLEEDGEVIMGAYDGWLFGPSGSDSDADQHYDNGGNATATEEEES